MLRIDNYCYNLKPTEKIKQLNIIVISNKTIFRDFLKFTEQIINLLSR